MSAFLSHPKALFFSSVLVVLALGAFLGFTGDHDRPSLILYCAAGIRPPVEELTKEYETATGIRIEIRSGPSERLWTQIRLTGQGDLFLPADSSYLDQAGDTIEEPIPLAQMRAVVLLRTGYTLPVEGDPPQATWDTFLRGRPKLGLADDAAAIGHLTKLHLTTLGRWQELESLTPTRLGDVNLVANAVKMGTVDAAIVWDAVARSREYRSLDYVQIPELDGIQADVKIAVLKGSNRTETARDFAHYLANRRAIAIFREHGFQTAAK